MLTYERADGTIEHALNAEEAIRRCPVLGGMALEEANVLLELMTEGQEILARQDEEVAPAPATERNGLEKTPFETAGDEPLLTSKIIESINQVGARLEHSHSVAKRIAVEQEEIEQIINQRPTEQRRAIIEAESVQDDISDIVAAPAAKSAEARVSYPELPTLHTDNLSQISDIVETQFDPENSEITIQEVEPESQPTQGLNLQIDLPTEGLDEVPMARAEEAMPKAAGTSQQLLVSNGISSEISETNADTQDVGGYEVIPESSFEQFIESVSVTETHTIEEIRETAEGQTLKETLQEVASYLISSAIHPEAAKVIEILQDISQELMLDEVIDSKGSFEDILNPRITSMMITLLREVGYEHPMPVLQEFVSSHEPEFVHQVLLYLARLAHEDNQQEFLAHRPRLQSLRLHDNSAIARWGKALFGIMFSSSRRVELVAIE